MKEKFSKDIETLKNNQTEILEIRGVFTPIKRKGKERKTNQIIINEQDHTEEQVPETEAKVRTMLQIYVRKKSMNDVFLRSAGYIQEAD